MKLFKHWMIGFLLFSCTVTWGISQVQQPDPSLRFSPFDPKYRAPSEKFRFFNEQHPWFIKLGADLPLGTYRSLQNTGVSVSFLKEWFLIPRSKVFNLGISYTMAQLSFQTPAPGLDDFLFHFTTGAGPSFSLKPTRRTWYMEFAYRLHLNLSLYSSVDFFIGANHSFGFMTYYNGFGIGLEYDVYGYQIRTVETPALWRIPFVIKMN